MRKVQVFSGSNQHARALEHFDKEPPLAVPRALREKRRQINAHAQDGHNQACAGCFGARAFTAAVAAARHSHENAGGWFEELQGALLQRLLDCRPRDAQSSGGSSEKLPREINVGQHVSQSELGRVAGDSEDADSRNGGDNFCAAAVTGAAA